MLEFRAQALPYGDSVELYARMQRDGKMMVITCDGLNIREATPGEIWPKFLSLPMELNAAQSLFDALWSAGLRPNKGEASAAHVEALKYHLEDMRKLVFQLLVTR